MQDDTYEICKVCGDKAGNCVYYGGRCCPCCRQFFRRSVVAFSRLSKVTYLCTCPEKCSDHENTLCIIKKESRAVCCKYCRYQKCLKQAGLNPKYVVAQYIPKVERSKKCLKKTTSNITISDVLLLQHEEDVLHKSSQTMGITKEMSMKPYLHDIQIITELSKKFDQDYWSISVGENVTRQKIMASIFGIPLSLECHVQACRVTLQRIVKVALGYTPFTSLPFDLQSILLKNNSMLIFSLRLIFMDQRKPGMETLSPHDCEKTKKLIHEIRSSPDKTSKLKIDYNTKMARFGIKEKTLLERHKLLEARVGERLNINPLMTSLISYILLFSTDIEDVCSNELSRIEKAQETLVLILQRYIYANCSTNIAYLKFSRIMESLADIRELCHIINNASIVDK